MTFYDDNSADLKSGADSFSPSRYISSLLLDIRKYVFWSTALFAFSLLLGYVISFYNPSLLDTLMASVNLPEPGPPFEFAVLIFINNAQIAGMLVFLGFIFALLPILILFVNGMFVGVVSESVLRTESLAFLLVGLLPHGIIEIPLILISAGLGIKMGVGTFQVFLSVKNIRQYLLDFLVIAGIFFIIIVPLLFVAAMIESYVTGFLLEYLL